MFGRKLAHCITEVWLIKYVILKKLKSQGLIRSDRMEANVLNVISEAAVAKQVKPKGRKRKIKDIGESDELLREVEIYCDFEKIDTRAVEHRVNPKCDYRPITGLVDTYVAGSIVKSEVNNYYNKVE